MFSVCCPRHQRRVLLTAAEMLSLSPAPGGGFVIGYRCFCGYEGQWSPGDCDENCEESWPGGLGVSPAKGRREPPRIARMAG